MRLLTVCVSLAAFGLVAPSALAQRRPPTSVQLPTIRYFGVGTTVWVPDRGSAYLGGVNRARSGSGQFGAPLLPFGNRAGGSSVGATGASVSAYVHDFRAMDEALLGGSPSDFQARRGELPPLESDPLITSRNSTGARPAPSVDDVRQRRMAAEQTRASEALVFFERGQKAEAAGKPNVAKIYYQMVTRRATGSLKERSVARLEAIRGDNAAVAAK